MQIQAINYQHWTPIINTNISSIQFIWLEIFNNINPSRILYQNQHTAMVVYYWILHIDFYIECCTWKLILFLNFHVRVMLFVFKLNNFYKVSESFYSDFPWECSVLFHHFSRVLNIVTETVFRSAKSFSW